MKIRLVSSVGLSIAILVGSISMPNLMAQDKKGAKKAAEKANIQGTVENMSKDQSTITVRTSGTATRIVVYSPTTKFLAGHSDNNKPGALAQVKTSNFISCAGTFDEKARLMATECVYRDQK
jgi:O-acetylhomoserine/O-acetylserine sulfhydrylase-like pyridoxal-dependent enzyme